MVPQRPLPDPAFSVQAVSATPPRRPTPGAPVRTRPLATAAAAALLVRAAAGPAAARGTAASTAKPAAGTATSALTLLSLALAGHDVKVGTVALTSDTLSG